MTSLATTGDNWSTLFGVLLNKSLYCMFPDPFLPRVAVTVGKGSGYARLSSAMDTLWFPGVRRFAKP